MALKTHYVSSHVSLPLVDLLPVVGNWCKTTTRSAGHLSWQVGGPGRHSTCTLCRASRPTLKNPNFGSMLVSGGWHRGGGWHRWRWVAPVEVGGTCGSGWHLWKWVAPVEVGGTGGSGWHRGVGGTAKVGGTRRGSVSSRPPPLLRGPRNGVN